MPPTLLTQYTDITALVTLLRDGGATLLTPWVEFAVDGTYLEPGSPVRFAWDVAGAGHLSWQSVDLALDVVTGGDVEHVWDRDNVAWPPARVGAEGTDGIWPPPGMVSDVAAPGGAGRAALYTGLGAKTLRLTVTPRDAHGTQPTISAEVDITVAAPAGAAAVLITGPRQASWNSGYAVHGQLRNNSAAAITFAVSVSGSDGSAFAAQNVRLAAGSSTEQDLAGPIVQNWQWVDKPTYHVEPSQLRKTFAYTAVVTDIVDEFGNAYPAAPQPPATVVVTVPESKTHDATLSETNWWIATGFAAGGAVSGALASIPVVTAIFAPIAAGAALEAIYYGSVAAMYAQSADDPPSPDANYGLLVQVPPPLLTPDNDPMPATSALAASLHRIARCQLAASATVSRLLGARQAADKPFADLHTGQFELLLSTATAEIGKARTAAEQAIIEVSQDPTLTPAAIAESSKVLAAKGVAPETAKALTAQLGEPYGSNVAALLADAKFAASAPPLADLLSALPFLAEQSARTSFASLAVASRPVVGTPIVA